MIAQIQGKIILIEPTRVVIDCNGIGYELLISLQTYSNIKEKESIRLYTHLYLQTNPDSNLSFFGFFDTMERTIFRLLIGVSGIGPSTAIIMLSSMTPLQIRNFIVAEDVKKIQTIKGIGLKTAQRVILELKDKLIKLYDDSHNISPSFDNSIKEETLSALEVLGYKRKQVEKSVDAILQEKPDTSIESLIKQVLNKI